MKLTKINVELVVVSRKAVTRNIQKIQFRIVLDVDCDLSFEDGKDKSVQKSR
jgi:hypothetical protein